MENLKQYNKEELKRLKNNEQDLLSSSEVLFEAALKFSDKNEKTNKLLDRIDNHKSNINLLNVRLYELIQEEKMDLIKKEKLNETLNIDGIDNDIYVKLKTGEMIQIIDDVFKSELCNYYVVSFTGGKYIPVHNIDVFDEKSEVGKWIDFNNQYN